MFHWQKWYRLDYSLLLNTRPPRVYLTLGVSNLDYIAHERLISDKAALSSPACFSPALNSFSLHREDRPWRIGKSGQ